MGEPAEQMSVRGTGLAGSGNIAGDGRSDSGP